MFKVEDAVEELRSKSMVDIERETALKWGGRACASFQLAVQAGKLGERVRHLYEGENYRQEALEHASMAEDLGFLGEVVRNVDEYRKEALTSIQDLLTKTDGELAISAESEGGPGSRRTMRAGGKHGVAQPEALRTGSTVAPAGVRGDAAESGESTREAGKPTSVRGGRRNR